MKEEAGKKKGKLKKCRLCKYGIVIIALAVLLFVFINPILNWVVKGQLENMVSASSYGKEAKIGSLSYSLFSNSLTMEKVDLLFCNNSKFTTKTVGLKTERIQLDGVNWFSLLLSSGLSLDKIYVDEPYVVVGDSSSGSDPDSTEETLYNMLPFMLRPVEAGEVEIKHGELYRRTIRKSGIVYDTLANVDLAISMVSIDNKPGNSKLVYAGDAFLHIDSLISRQAASGYRYTASDIAMSSSESSVSVKKLTCKPFLTDEEFFSRHTYRTERFIFDANNIKADGFNFGSLLNEKFIDVNKVTVNDFYFEALTDKRLPENPNVEMQKMPAEMLGDTGYKVDIRKVLFNGQISKQAVHPDSEKGTVIFFTGVKLEVDNFKNFGDSECTLFARGNMQDAGFLELHLAIDLTTPAVNFNYYGSLGAMDATLFNSCLVVTNNLRIDSGDIDSIAFDAAVRNGVALASVTPVYSNLKITLLDKKDKYEKTINGVLMKDFRPRKSTPKEGEEPIAGEIQYEPRQGDTFLDFTLIVLLKGLGEVVGF